MSSEWSNIPSSSSWSVLELPQSDSSEVKQTDQQKGSSLPNGSLRLNELAVEKELEKIQEVNTISNTSPNFTCNESNIKLPCIDIPKFNGDPMDYNLFMRHFRLFILSKSISDAEKLLYLLHYCEGKAKETVSNCLMLEPTEALEEALHNLEERFGKTSTTATLLIEQLLHFPVMHEPDGDMLVKLAQFMCTCERRLMQSSYVTDLNSLYTIRSIVKKLPANLQEKWIEHLVETGDDFYRPTFAELRLFVERAAKIYTLMLELKT